MKKTFTLLLAALALVMPLSSRADEGMWLLSLLGKNYFDMQKAGFKLSPDDIYHVNQSCIKDAIVGLGNDGSPFWHFCTGEIISDQGLMTTNHHCGYGQLQKHSTVEHDYLRDGFWAYSLDQELPNPGLTASILVRMEDVTSRVNAVLSDDMSEDERQEAIDKISDQITNEAVDGTVYHAAVRPMFNGNQFFLFVHIIYKDVRLVGAPPSSMGKFGGDTDNWSWPRHTCDFSMFRIYTAPDGSPAPFDKNNVPLRPKHHLPVSISNIKEGQFAMVLGFPGTTNHYVTSYGLSNVMDVTNKLTHEIRTVKINILRDAMAASQAVRIQYASKYASCSNYWKYAAEQNKALRALNTMQIKRDLEADYLGWARSMAPKYSNALALISNAEAVLAPFNAAQTYLAEGLLSGPEMPFNAFRLGRNIKRFLDEQDPDLQDLYRSAALNAIDKLYKDYDEPTDRRLSAALFRYVYDHIDMNYCPKALIDADKKYKGDFVRFVNYVYDHSIFANRQQLDDFLHNPKLKTLERDPLYLLGQAFYDQYFAVVDAAPKSVNDDLQRGNRVFVDGILQMNQGRRLLSPDANSTIRLTYGNVLSYQPRDGVSYHYYTTLAGVIQKEDSSSSEFFVPARLKQLYRDHDFGRYANDKGELPTCFLTNNDITGGNSGSPVIDGRGRLIGLAFDGNGEAMSGDIDFEENLQRCICLDTRYMLWVIDKYANAQNLIDEIDIEQN